MAYTEDEKKEMFDKVCKEVSGGKALRTVLSREGFMNPQLFNQILSSSTEFSTQYVRACQDRADAIFEDTIKISDNRKGDTYIDNDGNEQIDHAVINRDRLRVDTRKWAAGKLRPKKYGDKLALDHTSEDGSMTPGVSLKDLSPATLLQVRKELHEAERRRKEKEDKKGSA